MKRSSVVLAGAILWAAASVAVGAALAQSESSATAGRMSTMLPAYDVTKEVKITGTIQKIDGFGTNGPIGTHILLQTAAGVVDAHLGFGAASSPKNLGIATGQNVTVVGMMESVGDGNVLMARILTTPNRIFVLRNEHGVPVRAVPRGSMPQRNSLHSVLVSTTPEIS